MKERMSWTDDERLYQPRVHSKRIRELHQIAEETGQSMTVIVDLALRRYVEDSKSPTLPDGYRQHVPGHASIGNGNKQKP